MVAKLTARLLILLLAAAALTGCGQKADPKVEAAKSASGNQQGSTKLPEDQ